MTDLSPNMLEYWRTTHPRRYLDPEDHEEWAVGTALQAVQEVVAAQYGPLMDRNALMTADGRMYQRIRSVTAAKEMQRNTSLSTATVHTKPSQKPSLAAIARCDEVDALRQVILLVY